MNEVIMTLKLFTGLVGTLKSSQQVMRKSFVEKRVEGQHFVPFLTLLPRLTLESQPVFIFANKAGLDMLETTLVALQNVTLDKMFDESGRKALLPEFATIMQQGFAYLPGGICLSTMGRHVSYEQAISWKVLSPEENAVHCLAFSFVNWSFV